MPSNVPAETKQKTVAQNIQEEQQKLLSEGNLSALSPEVVKGAAADAAVVTGKTETISKAAEEVIGAGCPLLSLANVIVTSIQITQTKIRKFNLINGIPLQKQIRSIDGVRPRETWIYLPNSFREIMN
jgi:hypothetical protein